MIERSDAGSVWIDPDDAPELTDEFFERAEIKVGNRVIRRGRPASGNAKKLVSLRIDQDVLQKLREMGEGWQTLANGALRAFVGGADAVPKSQVKKIRRNAIRKTAAAAPAKARAKPRKQTRVVSG